MFGNIPFINIKPYQLEQVKMNMLKKNRAAATIKYALSGVSQIWTLAKRDDLVFTDSPAKNVRLPKQDNARIRYLKEEEAKLMCFMAGAKKSGFIFCKRTFGACLNQNDFTV